MANNSYKINIAGALIGAIFFGLFGLAFAGAGVMIAVTGYRRDGWAVVLFSVPFVVIGLGLAAAAVASVPMARRRRRLQIEHPDQPWLWDSNTSKETIVDHALGGAIGAWIFAIIVNAIVLSIVWSLLRQRTHHAGELTLLIFVAIGFWLAINACRVTWRAIRFGQSVLRLNPMPGQIGGKLAGTIHVERSLPAGSVITLGLTCKSRDTRGENNTVQLLYEDEQSFAAPRGAGTIREIVFNFAIPAHFPPTRIHQGSKKAIEWKLEATAAKGGYRSGFTVPVFIVDAGEVNSGGAVSLDTGGPQVIPLDSEYSDEPASHSGILLTRLADGGCTIHFAAGRNWGQALFVTLLAIVFDAGGVLIRRTRPPLFAEIIVWFFGVVLTIATVNGWLSSTTITARPHGLLVDKGFPWRRSKREISAPDITDISASIGTSFNDRVYYNLQAVTPEKPITIASGILGKNTAGWLTAELRKSLQLTSK